MNKGHLADIRYTKHLPNGEREVTERTIIPTMVPTPNVRALDVTELSDAEQQRMLSAYADYQRYVETQMKNIFNFETWLEHTGTETAEPKWRMFRSDQLVVLDE